MRETHTAQTSIFQTATDHEIAHELKRMSDWLDGHPELLDQISKDLQSGGGSRRGRRGMTLDSVKASVNHFNPLRCRNVTMTPIIISRRKPLSLDCVQRQSPRPPRLQDDDLTGSLLT